MIGIELIEAAGIIVHTDNEATAGCWLESFDPEAYDGLGSATWTRDPARAMQFASTRAAFDCYRAVPRTVRCDLTANRTVR
jgi:hypothetical protein